MKFDNITKRLRNLCEGLDPRYIDPVLVTQKVVEGLEMGMARPLLDKDDKVPDRFQFLHFEK